MLSIWIGYLFFFFILWNTGHAFKAGISNILKLQSQWHDPFFTDFWMGYILITVILEIYSVFYRIDKYAVLILFLFSILSLILFHKSIFTTIRTYFFDNKYLLILMLVSGLYCASQASKTTQWFDTYLYHLNMVKWLSEYPTCTGACESSRKACI